MTGHHDQHHGGTTDGGGEISFELQLRRQLDVGQIALVATATCHRLQRLAVAPP
jgi:hypothetical protein